MIKNYLKLALCYCPYKSDFCCLHLPATIHLIIITRSDPLFPEEDAYHQLEQLLLATRKAGHTRYMLEVMIEMALSAQACKHKTEAQSMLHEVLVLALANNPVRLFLDAGEPMVILLYSLLPQIHDQPLLAYIR